FYWKKVHLNRENAKENRGEAFALSASPQLISVDRAGRFLETAKAPGTRRKVGAKPCLLSILG
ncbi:MAG: hypothetical protein NZM11_01970, partial [Anaerolineales bacterium]|nr:hypothetical protein [Anaerolineales bacterium]